METLHPRSVVKTDKYRLRARRVAGNERDKEADSEVDGSLASAIRVSVDAHLVAALY